MKGIVFTWVTAYGGALLALFYPYVGMLIYVLFAILKPEAMWFWELTPGNYSRVIAITMIVGWAIQGFGNWSFGRAKVIVTMFVGFWAWTVAAAFFAQDQTIAWNFVSDLSKIVLPFVVGLSLIDSVDKLRQLAWVIALTQGYVAFELNLAYRNGINRVLLEGYGGMDNNSVAIGMVTGVGLAFFLGLSADKLWKKGLAFLCALMMAHVVLFSFSRGGMLALVITGVVGFFLTPRKPQHYAALGIAAMLVLALSGPEVRKRFTSVFADKTERDASSESRLKLWADNWDLMLKHPVFGVGPHQWPLVAPEYGWPKGKEGHSLWFQTGAELGFPGVGMLIMFYIYCMARLWPMAMASRPPGDPFFQDAARMVCAALVGFSVAAQFVSLTFLEVPYYVVLLGAGVLRLAPATVGVPRQSWEVAEPSYSAPSLREA